MAIDRYQDRGPQSSASFNKNNREVAKRLVDLQNGLIDIQGRTNELERSFSADATTTTAYADKLSAISFAIGKSLAGNAFMAVGALNVIKDGSGDPTEADGVTKLANPMYVDERAGIITLGQSSVEHKLRFEPVPGTWQIHPEVLYDYAMAPSNHHATLNSAANAIDGKTMRPFLAYGETPEALQMTYYVSLPHLAVSNTKSNMLGIDLAPGFHCSLIDLQYADTPNPQLAEGGHWKSFPVEVSNPVGSSFKDRWQFPYSSGNHQDEMSFRRFYFPDTLVTGVRAVVKTKMDGTDPVPVDLDGTSTYMVGIRDLDVAHVNFASTGSLVVEAKLPKNATAIDLTNTQAICVNQGSGGVYTDTIEVYTLVGETWTKYLGGAINTDTIRVKITASLVQGTSPALAGIDFIYS